MLFRSVSNCGCSCSIFVPIQRDLSLTKGELVLLIKQVDENWLEGQVGTKQGYLPANYIEVSCLDDLVRETDW